MSSLWIERFNGLADIEFEWKALIKDQSRVLSMPSGTKVFEPGKPAEHMIFLMNGTVRVQQVSQSGREIVLYRIEAGQSCIMTASCLIGHQEYSAEGVAETEIEAAVIPRNLFDELIAKSECFRNFVFSTFSMRLSELMFIINEVVFRRLDIRLAKKLLYLADENNLINTTHQKLAVELGTVREVISRQLQEFHRVGLIEQSRGSILITEKRKLIDLSIKDD